MTVGSAKFQVIQGIYFEILSKNSEPHPSTVYRALIEKIAPTYCFY